MTILKNTYGVTAVFKQKICKFLKNGEFTGSSISRKPQRKELIIKTVDELLEPKVVHSEKKDRSMSSRTKSKIRAKVTALSTLFKNLSFVTLTFVNEVTDEQGIEMLRKFLDNMKKRKKDFQYLWVAEKQTKNKVFKNNIHFHLITNKYWGIETTKKYWLDLQKKHGVVPREEHFNASSSFDVKGLVSNNIKGISMYITKYITKNVSTFKCQVWNCSKKISALYTGFYSDGSFLENIRLVPDIKITEVEKEYCHLHYIPLNKTTLRFYDNVQLKNKKAWGKLS